MTPERWAQIEELFHRAAECEPEYRTALLDEACSTDPGLRQEVEALLSCEASAGKHVQAAVGSEIEGFSFPLAGEVVSHYRILDGLSGGGMGLVYRAEDIKLGRHVALKFLPEEAVKDPAALARFEREARAASALEHPNICPIYEFGEHEGRPFLAMQLLEGQTLREMMSAAGSEKRLLEVGRLLDLAIQITDGLGAAHHKGIIHRDIKPANIFVTSQGEAKILDFGLAKLTCDAAFAGDASEQDARGDVDAVGGGREIERTHNLLLTRTGVAMGTAGYMSPEQVRGEKLDARTDLFSFGLVLYEMATGRRAFAGETAQALKEAILKQTPSPARQLNPSLPTKLERVISKALENDRTARYQSASEIRADLERLRQEAEPRRRLIRWRPVVAGMFVVLGIAAAFWYASRQPVFQVGLPVLKQRQLTANPSDNAVVGGAISPDGKYLAYSDLHGLHVKLIETGATHDVPQPGSLRGMQVNWGIVSNWAPDGTRFVANAKIQGRPSSIWLVPLTGEPRKVRDDAFAEATSRDGSWIAFGRRYQEMWVKKSDGGQERKVFQAAEGDGLFGGEWSPDGQRLLYNYFRQMNDGGEYTLESRDLVGGPRVTAVASHRNNVLDWTWLPDGRVLYSIAEPVQDSDTCNYWTVRLDPRTGKPSDGPKRVTDWAGFCADTSSVTADSRRLAFRRWAWQSHVDVAELEVDGVRTSHLKRLTQTEGRTYPASWTTDSKSVVFGAYRDGQWKIFRQSLDQDTAEPIVTGTKDMFGAEARVSPDGAWVLYTAPPLDQSAKYVGVRLMRAPMKGGPSELVLTARIPQYGVYHNPLCARAPATLCVITEESEDHKRLIFTAFDPVRGRGSELARFDGSNGEAYDWDLSPDGTRMAVLRVSKNLVHIMPLDGKSSYDIAVKNGAALQTVNWTADGKGVYAASVTPQGSALLHIDLLGNAQALSQQKGSVTPWGSSLDLGMGGPTAPWAVPSPDGRHVAIYTWTLSSNMWMMENF